MSVFCFATTIAPIGLPLIETGSATPTYVRRSPGGGNSKGSGAPEVQSIGRRAGGPVDRRRLERPKSRPLAWKRGDADVVETITRRGFEIRRREGRSTAR